MDNAKVSIVLPTYNGSRFIREAIEGVLQQTYGNWELIIVNDGSTDDTGRIIKEYAEKDQRIKAFTNHANLKLPASLNVGFSRATGEYFTWTSDDNYYMPGAITYMVEYLEKHPETDLISCNAMGISEKGDAVGIMAKSKRDTRTMIKHSNVGTCFLYTKKIAEEVGDYDTATFCAEDYDYFLRIALAGNIDYCDEVLYVYRYNKRSLTATKKDLVDKNSAAVRLKHYEEWLKKFKLSRSEKAAMYYRLWKDSGENAFAKKAVSFNPLYIFKIYFKKLKQM